MIKKADYNYKVSPQQVDATLSVRVSSILNSVLEVAGVDATKNNFGVEQLLAEGHTWVLSRLAIEIDYRPEQYTPYCVTTWISDYSRMLSTRNFELLIDGGKPFARCTTEWAILDIARRTAVNLMQFEQLKGAVVDGSPSPISRPRRVGAFEPVDSYEHQIAYSDIDFNRHVSTMSYINIMLNHLPISLLERQGAMRLDVHFMREALYGGSLKIVRRLVDGEALFEIQNSSGELLVRSVITFT